MAVNDVEIPVKIVTEIDESKLAVSIQHIKHQLDLIKDYTKHSPKNDMWANEQKALNELSTRIESTIKEYERLKTARDDANKKAMSLSVAYMNASRKNSGVGDDAKSQIKAQLDEARTEAKALNREYEAGRDILAGQITELVKQTNTLANLGKKYEQVNRQATATKPYTGDTKASEGIKQARQEAKEIADNMKLATSEVSEFDERIKDAVNDNERLNELASELVRKYSNTGNVQAQQVIEMKKILKARAEELAMQEKSANSGKQVLTEEQKAAKQSLTDARSRASANYYVLRSLKMLEKQVDNIRKAVLQLDSGFMNFGKKAVSMIAKLAVGFGLLHKSTKKTTTSHQGFVGSLKTGFMTILKYTLGIRSFYFLLNKLRKALRDSMGVLAQSSSLVNEQMSSLLSNVSWMKNMLATVAQPLLNILVPAINAVANAFNRAAYSIASFFATLTGQSFVFKATKQMEDYAASLDKTSKSAKKAKDNVQSFDELHIISDSDSDSGSGGAASAFEPVEVETAASDMAEKVKDILSTLFDPIKKAWDEKGKFVMDSWKFALEEVGKLIQSVGRDFLEVWSNDTGKRIWEDIFQIVGDIGLVVGYLAKNFRLAWEENKKGKRILEAIQQLIYIIVHAIRECADATVEWAKNLDFNPLLQATLDLLRAIRKPVQFIADTFKAFWNTVLLPFKKYIIEDGLPLLMHTIEKIINMIDWDKLTKRMQDLMDAVGTLLPKVFEALVIVLEDLGEAIANLLNSDGIGSLIDKFKDWAENVKPEDIAKGIERLIEVLAGLTIGFTVGDALLKLSTAFFTFRNVFLQADVMKTLKNFNTLMGKTSKKGLSGAVSNALTSIKNFNSSGKTFVNVLEDIGKVAVTSLSNIGTTIKNVVTHPIESLKTGIASIKTAFSGLGGGVDALRTKIGPLGQALAGIVGTVAEFKLVSSGISGLMTDADNKGKNIIKTIAGIAAGLAGLTLMLGFPAGPIAAGLVGIIALFKGMRDAMVEVNEVNLTESLTAEVEGVKYSFDDLETAVKGDVESITGHLDELHTKFETIDTNEDSFINIKNSVYGLATAIQYQSNVTDEEMNNLQDSIGDLKAAWEDYVSSQYDYTIAATVADMQYLESQGKLTEEMKEQYSQRLAALYDEKNTAIESVDVTVSKLEELNQQYANGKISSKEYSDGVLEIYGSNEYLNQSFAETADHVNETANSLSELKGSLDVSTEGIKSTDEYVQAFADNMSEASTIVSSGRDEINQAISDIDEQLKTATGENEASLQQHKEVLQGQMTELDGVTQQYAQILQENIANQGKQVIEDAIADYEEMSFMEKTSLSLFKGIDSAEAYAESQFNTFSNDVINGENGLVTQMNEQLGLAPDQLWIDEFGTEVTNKLWNTDIYNNPNGTSTVTTKLVDDWNSIFDDTVSQLDSSYVGEMAVEGMYNGVEGSMKSFTNSFKTSFAQVGNIARDVLGVHSPSTVFIEIGGFLTEGLFNGLSGIWDRITPIFTELTTNIQSVTDLMLTNLTTGVTNMITNLTTNVTLFKDSIVAIFNTLPITLGASITLLQTNLVTKFDAIKTSLISKVTVMFTNLQAKFTAGKTALVNIVTALKTSVLQIFDGLNGGIKTAINTMLTAVETLANGVVAGINKVIEALNSFRIDVPQWVTDMTGMSSFGFNLTPLSTISIPRLAQGAVIPPNKEFLAMLGDQKHGTNIEAPLDTIKQAVAEVISDEMLSILSQQLAVLQEIYEKDTDVNIGDEAIARASVRGQRKLGIQLRTT